jgi:hypothetical protein
MSKRRSVLAGAITKGVVLMEKIAGSFTNAPSATETTHSRLVVNHNSLSCNFQFLPIANSFEIFCLVSSGISATLFKFFEVIGDLGPE